MQPPEKQIPYYAPDGPYLRSIHGCTYEEKVPGLYLKAYRPLAGEVRK
jgi:hypothetical protein